MEQKDFCKLDKTILLGLLSMFSTQFSIPMNDEKNDTKLCFITYQTYLEIQKLIKKLAKKQKYSTDDALKDLDSLIKEAIKDLKKVQNKNNLNNVFINTIQSNSTLI